MAEKKQAASTATAAVATKKAGKGLTIKLVTGLGKFAYPHLVVPNSSGEFPSDKFEIKHLMPKASWKEAGANLREAIMAVARDKYGPDIAKTLKDFPNPLSDGDTKDQDYYKGMVIITPKSSSKPRVLGPKKNILTDDEVKAIKGGDYGRLVVSIYGYTKGKGGIGIGLEAVQFSHVGEAIGGGNAAAINLLDDLEVELDTPAVDDSPDEEDLI